jgi:hypothetical protein
MKEFLILVIFLIGGCSTTHLAGIDSYELLDNSKIVGELPRVKDVNNSATIVVKRDRGFMGSALKALFTINGKPLADLRPGQYIMFNVDPGEYIFGVRSAEAFGALDANVFREISLDCKPMQHYYLRLFPQPVAGIQIQRSSY